MAGKKRLPPQLTKVEEGDKLRFLRPVKDGEAYLSKSSDRVCYVLDVSPVDLILIAFPTPLRGLDGAVDGHQFFSCKGYKYCRVVDLKLLLDNCVKVG